MAGLNPQQLRALQQMFSQRADKDDGLVTFRAGRLFMDEGTKMVTADKKRGKIKLLKDEQGLLKFQWFNRISNQKELDLTIFPQSAAWHKVTECKDGRVYVLKMVGSSRKHFFWSQEPKEDKDEEWFTNVNKLCSGESLSDDKSAASGASSSAQPNPYGALPSAGFGASAGGGANDAMAQMILNALSQNQQVNAPAAASSSSGAAATGAGANAATGANPSNDLLQQMANMMREQQRAAVEEMKREPDLEDILDPTTNQEITALLDDEKIVEELAQHLPESMRSRSDIMDQLQSPQFQGSLRRLQSAINGPQMPTLLQQMGINGASENAMGVTAFVNAIQPEDDKEKEKEKEKDEDGDANMEDKDKKDKEQDKSEDKDKEKSNEDITDIYQ